MVNWSLNEQQADYIVKVLAQRPFAEVNELLQDLVRQANASVRPPQAVSVEKGK